MPISNLSFAVANELSRQGSVFLKAAGTATYYNGGKVRDVEVSISPVTGDADTGGREKMLAADVEIQFVMQQTSDTEVGTLPDLLGQAVDAKVTESVTTDATAAGREFLNCLLSAEGTLNFMGEGSSFTFTTGGRVPVNELSSLVSGGTIDFGA